MSKKVTGAFYSFKDNVCLLIKGSYFHSKPIAHCVHMYAFELFVSTGRGTPSAVLTHTCTPVVVSLLLAFHGHVVCVGSTGPFS